MAGLSIYPDSRRRAFYEEPMHYPVPQRRLLDRELYEEESGGYWDSSGRWVPRTSHVVDVRAKRAKEDDERFRQRLELLRQQFGGGASTVPQVQISGSSRSRRAAEDAEFARAKDRISQSLQGLLRSAQQLMASRGLVGSSIESDLTANVLARGHGELGEVLRQQAIEAARRAQEVEDRNLRAALEQRAQDIQLQQLQQQQALEMLRAVSAGLY